MSKLNSRTFWMVLLIISAATGLTWFGKIDGAGWTTTVLGCLAAWQVRRYGDNKLLAGNREG